MITTSHPDFDAEHLRVAVSDGQVIAMALFIACRLRIGRAVVPANVVAPVAVAPEHQHQGHGLAVMQDAAAAMQRAGHVLSHLWGHPGFYERLGYSAAVPRCGVTAEVEALRALGSGPAGYQVVPLQAWLAAPENTPAALEARLAALWNKNTAAITLSDVRDEAASPAGSPGGLSWRWALQGPAADHGLALDRDGMIAGYYQALAMPGRVEVFEAAIRDGVAAAAMLSHLARLAEEWGAVAIELRLPAEHPLARAAWTHGGHLHTAYTPAGMVRVLDMARLFECLHDEFNRRLAHSELHGHTGMLAVHCNDEQGAATVALRGGLVGGVMARAVAGAPLVELPLAQLNALVTGLRPAAEIAAQPGATIEPGALRLLEVMFPAGCPQGPWWPIFQE